MVYYYSENGPPSTGQSRGCERSNVANRQIGVKKPVSLYVLQGQDQYFAVHLSFWKVARFGSLKLLAIFPFRPHSGSRHHLGWENDAQERITIPLQSGEMPCPFRTNARFHGCKRPSWPSHC